MVKQNIPKKIKIDSWDKWIGEEFGVYNCLCCNRTKIKQTTFHGGHFKSEKNGGKISVNNIIPICSGCNSSMGSKNMDNYLELFEPERYQFLLRTPPKWFIYTTKPKHKNNSNSSTNIKLKYTCWKNTLNGIIHNKYYEHNLRGKTYYISDDKYRYIYNKLKNNKVGKEIGKYSDKGYPIYYNKINNIKKIELFLQRFNLAQLKQLYLLFFYKNCHLKKHDIVEKILEAISFNEIQNIIYNLSDNIKYIKSCKCKFVFLTRKTNTTCKQCNSNIIFYNNLII